MNKNILITGASRGLGKFLAESMAHKEDTSSLTLVARTQDLLEEEKKALRGIKPKLPVHTISGDLSTSSGITKTIEELKKTGIEYNVLINNAGYGVIETLDNITDEEIEKMFFVNLIAPLRLSKFFIPVARKNRWGRIINISSIATHTPSPAIIPYIVSKSGLKSLSECINVAEVQHGITANTILPGLMLTDMGKMSIKKLFPHYDETNALEIEGKMASRFPSKKITELTEIAGIIHFLLSNEGGSISGEFIRVASGLI